MDRRRPHLPTERALRVDTGFGHGAHAQNLSTESTSSCDSLMTQVPLPFYSQDHQQAYNFVPNTDPFTTPTIIQDPSVPAFPPRQQPTTPSLDPTSASYVPNSYQQSFASNDSSFQSHTGGSMGNFSRGNSMDSVTSYQPSQTGPGFPQENIWVPNSGQQNYQGNGYQGGGYQGNGYQATRYPENNYQAGPLYNNNYAPNMGQQGAAGNGSRFSESQNGYNAFGTQGRGYGNAAHGEHTQYSGGMQSFSQRVSSPGIGYGATSITSPDMNQQALPYNAGASNQMISNMYGNLQTARGGAPLNATALNDGRHVTESSSTGPAHQYLSKNRGKISNDNSSVSSKSKPNLQTERSKTFAQKRKAKGKSKNKQKGGSTESGQPASSSGSVSTLNENLKNLKVKDNNTGGPVASSGNKARYIESSEGSSIGNQSETSLISNRMYTEVSYPFIYEF